MLDQDLGQVHIVEPSVHAFTWRWAAERLAGYADYLESGRITETAEERDETALSLRADLLNLEVALDKAGIPMPRAVEAQSVREKIKSQRSEAPSSERKPKGFVEEILEEAKDFANTFLP